MNEITVIKNADNDHIMPWGGRGFVIGAVDEVNGRGAEEISSFTPTRHELIQIAKYWRKRYLDDAFFCFTYATSGSTEMRREAFAMRRISRIAELIGEEEINRAIEEVDAEFEKSVEGEAWNWFKNNDTHARDNWLDQFHNSLDNSK